LRARAFLRLLIRDLLFVGGDFGQDVGAVNVGIDLLPDLDDLAFGGDEEGVAGGELHLATGHDGDAVGIDDFVVGVGEHLEVEGVLGAPGFVALDGIEADAEDDGVEGVVLIEVTLEVVGLDGATLGLVLGVEVEDDPLAFEVGEADGLVFLGGQSKVGSGSANLGDVGRGCCMSLDAEAADCYDGGECCDPKCFAHDVFLFG
jgi:hypothetical protein